MIQYITGTLRFIEADIICRTRKRTTLFSLILNLFVISLLFHFIIFLPFIFIQGKGTLSPAAAFLFSLLPFTFLFIRIIRESADGKKLDNTQEYYKKDRDSVQKMLISGIRSNLTLCSILYAAVCVYLFALYGIFSLFAGVSFFFFIIAFLISALISGIICFTIFVSYYVRDKNLFWPSILLPFLGTLFSFLLLLTVRSVLHLPFIVIYCFSFASGWFLTFPLLKRVLRDNNLIVTYRFILFLFILILILFFLSSLTKDYFHFIPDGVRENLFLKPLFHTLTAFLVFIRTGFLSHIAAAFIFPHLFVPVLLVSKTIYEYSTRVRRKIILRRGNEDREAVFTGGLSLYPLLWIFFRTFLIAGILFLEISPVSELLYSLVTLFKIPEIFHLEFLTQENIFFFFTFIFYIIIAVFGVRMIDFTLMHVCSSFSFYAASSPETLQGELIYSEKRLISRSVLCVPLQKIQSLMYHQTLCERCFNTGTLTIKTADMSGSISLRCISRIKDKYSLIMDKMKRVV